MDKQVVIFIAPPGAGKGTQAEAIAAKFSFYHIETSKLGEAKIKDPELVKNDPEVARAKKCFETGELFPTEWATRLIIEKIEELAGQNKNIVFSGSPRTPYEVKNIMPDLDKLYSRENIKIFHIELSEEESVKRNSGRRICQANRHPIPNFSENQNLTTCPQDGSPLVVRDLDKPEIIRERYRVYKAETEPVLDYFSKNGYKVTTINGEQPIKKVTEDILKSFYDPD